MEEKLMEAVVTDENYRLALAAVKRNRGAAGIDRMTTAQLEPHLQANWGILPDKLRKGTYVPTPVRRVEIPKPSGGRAAQQYAQGGKEWVVDLDITKFLDRVPYCPLVIEKAPAADRPL
jgi:retron-type reverse transcriptase